MTNTQIFETQQQNQIGFDHNELMRKRLDDYNIRRNVAKFVNFRTPYFESGFIADIERQLSIVTNLIANLKIRRSTVSFSRVRRINDWYKRQPRTGVGRG